MIGTYIVILFICFYLFEILCEKAQEIDRNIKLYNNGICLTDNIEYKLKEEKFHFTFNKIYICPKCKTEVRIMRGE